MVWFHTECVSISNIDDVGAWVCDNFRQSPKMVQQMKSQLEMLNKSTCQIQNTIGKLSDDLDITFTNLNACLTSMANQNKLTGSLAQSHSLLSAMKLKTSETKLTGKQTQFYQNHRLYWTKLKTQQIY